MSPEYDQRAAVIVAHRTGRSPGEITNFLILLCAIVYRFAQRFDEPGQSLEPARKTHSTRSDTKCDVMPPHFFVKGEMVNAKTYLKVLQEIVKPWIKEVAGGEPSVFQKDSASTHTAHIVVN